jgi:5-methylcytosine-specific restriction endonuclease McrA
VRDPRPGLSWSGHRFLIRARYGGYMGSAQWFRRREGWLVEYRAAHGGEYPTCAVCGAEWSLSGGDLHHRSYARLGHEDWRDLMPLCRPDHRALHALMEANPAWRRLSREQASDLIAAWLRARTDKEHDRGQKR